MPGMESNQTCTMIGAAISRGIADFNLEKAYQACLKSETDYHNRPAGVGKEDLNYFWEDGYIPTDKSPRAAGSHTLEYSYTCWVTAQIAGRLHKTSRTMKKLMQASRSWENIFDAQNGFFSMRAIPTAHSSGRLIPTAAMGLKRVPFYNTPFTFRKIPKVSSTEWVRNAVSRC